jgi:dTDP-glucose 4,6-dehydratase
VESGKRMHLLVTGGCGFIGSNFIRMALRDPSAPTITNADLLTYAGNAASLSDVVATAGERYRFRQGDIADAAFVQGLFAESRFDAVINFAAESHVDRSITGPEIFVRTNVVGAYNVIEAARQSPGTRFVQVSTDEVYGSLGPDGFFVETLPLQPSSAYSASKASADLLALANFHTFGQDVVVTRCSNNYGPYQFPEKLIPLMIIKAMRDQSLPVYGDGRNIRDWIHVEDHCRGIMAVLKKGRTGEVYNLGASTEWENIEIVRLILRTLDKPESLITFVKDRPGHDRRYAMDSRKAQRELGWEAQLPFPQAMADTIAWYLANESWWRPLMK